MHTFHWIPDRCTAMFYTGLGGALTCAGIFFLVIFIQNFLREKKGKMDQGIYKNYLKILKEELLPATGCTEPIAVAYAAAVARDLLGEEVKSAVIAVSGNILKNVKSVVVPHTGGLRGIPAAVCAGIAAGDASKSLEVISSVSDDKVLEIKKMLSALPVQVDLAENANIFDIRVTLCSEHHTASVRIADFHTNIVSKEVDGKFIFRQETEKGEEVLTDRSCLTVENIFRFANEVALDDIKPVLSRQIEYNMATAAGNRAADSIKNCMLTFDG